VVLHAAGHLAALDDAPAYAQALARFCETLPE
jgi:hypothetical protein